MQPLASLSNWRKPAYDHWFKPVCGTLLTRTGLSQFNEGNIQEAASR